MHPMRETRAGGDDAGSSPSPASADRTEERRHSARQRREWLWRLVIAVAPRLLSAALWLLSKTVRIEYTNADDLFGRWARGEQVIIAFWHNRAVMMPLPFQGRGRKLCIMNSQHRDGEIATRALARWGIRSVRGSATRGGAAGFLQLVNAYRDGYDLAVVPDGPRGPRYHVKPGVIHLARVTGAPIFPVTYAATRARRLRSWDRLIIPLPFARVHYVIGEPLVVPRYVAEPEAESLRRELEGRLNAITQAADARAGA
jgi:lysophospholipid acyltransferase (LPLAT)-like uncharacterized protein